MSDTDTNSAAVEGTAGDDAVVESDTESAAETEASTADAAVEGTAGDDAVVESDFESAVETEASTADATAEGTAGDDAVVESDAERSARKVRDGVVTSAGMDKTIVVTITERVRHARYNKFILQSKKLYTHDETNDAGVGDKVRVMECRPLSKSKRWRLVEVTERAR